MDQISIFELLNTDYEMYDGFKVENDADILLPIGGIHRLSKGIYYLVTKISSKAEYVIAFPNQFGGSSAVRVSENQFKKHFKALEKKVYPNSSKIWNGKRWIPNPNWKIS